jgi:WD40 repeat protein
MGSVTGLHWRPTAAAGTEGANGKRELLVTTSRYVVRTIDSDTGAVLVAHGTTGAGAGYLPNDRPPAFARKRQLPPCARYSPDGTAVAMGSFLHRTIIFDAASGDLVHLLKGRHASMVGCVEWNPTHPVLTAACRTVNVWHTPRPLTAPTVKSPFAL